MKKISTKKEPLVERLRAYLNDADDLLTAITRGEIDALMLPGPDGEQIFTLKGAERSYRLMLETMSEGAATINSQGTILYCNKRFAHMLGAPLEQVMGSIAHRWVWRDQRSTFMAMLEVGIEREIRGEMTLRTLQKGSLPVYLSVSALDTDQGETLCLVATDLSQQKRDQQIVASERLARSVLEQATEAIVVCDKEGQVIRASAAAHQLCGSNPLLRSFKAAYPLETDESFLRHAMQGRVVTGALGRLPHKGAATSILLISAGPLLGPQDTVMGCIVTMTDVTQLHSVQARMEAAILARDDFLSVASHELRSPLTALHIHLHSMARFLCKQVASAVTAALATKVQSAIVQTTRIDRLIDHLLDVTRLSAGKVHLDLAKVDLEEVVSDVVESCFESALNAGCDLQFERSGIIEGLWDRLRLEQVATNLISNAIKYAPAKPIYVSVGGNADDAWLTVRDEGIGIAPQDIERIFGRFERAVSKRHYGGLGLGLYITAQIVHALGGSVKVKSAVEHGSTFTVTLPLRPAELPAQDADFCGPVVPARPATPQETSVHDRSP